MPQNSVLHTSLAYLKGMGEKKATLLAKEFQLFSFYDLLYFFPFRYVDKTKYYKIQEIHEQMPYVQLIARVVEKQLLGEGRKKRMVLEVKDDTGVLELVWFQQPKWMENAFQIGEVYVIFGKPTEFNGRLNIAHPEMEKYDADKTKNLASVLFPVYHSTEKLKKFGLDTKGLAKAQWNVMPFIQSEIQETLPNYILHQFQLIGLKEALTDIHFPQDEQSLQHAQKRLKFEEFFFLQLKMLYQKIQHNTKFVGHLFAHVGEKFNTFYHELLPFSLTNAQKKVIKEIRADVNRPVQMNRLVQGDVGSGKTVVALMSMLLAVDNGFQACMMAPTEILAQQHFESVRALVPEGFVKVAFLSGSTTTKQRRILHEELVNGDIHILIGTHALIEDKVQFHNLGLVVIDEQHRFGVEQRAKLWRKNHIPPHILVMTATPIPRTLAMTLYGDLEVSVIDELPAGRKPIQTVHLYETHRLRMYGIMREEIAKGRQVYVVFPLIQESEKLDLLYLEQGLEHLEQQFPMPQYQIAKVHGKLSNADKNAEMEKFISGKAQIMVATTVIEVGVNVPNASVMVIENAERFGLSQLHQLRGRVGRGAEQSFCILMSDVKLSREGRLRLQTMVETNNGFDIAEVDLKLRGPGDISGTRQSGVLDMKIADLVKDQSILQVARHTVIEILERDPNLIHPENQLLKTYLQQQSKGLTWDKIS